jgi:hypothetical protein
MVVQWFIMSWVSGVWDSEGWGGVRTSVGMHGLEILEGVADEVGVGAAPCTIAGKIFGGELLVVLKILGVQFMLHHWYEGGSGGVEVIPIHPLKEWVPLQHAKMLSIFACGEGVVVEPIH